MNIPKRRSTNLRRSCSRPDQAPSPASLADCSPVSASGAAGLPPMATSDVPEAPPDPADLAELDCLCEQPEATPSANRAAAKSVVSFVQYPAIMCLTYLT
jgi:hypothetical protein